MTEPHWAINTICRTYHKGQHHAVELIEDRSVPNTQIVWALVFDISMAVRQQVMRDVRACFDGFAWDGRSTTLMPAVVRLTETISSLPAVRHYLGDKRLGCISIAGIATCHDSFTSQPVVAFRRGRFRVDIDDITALQEHTEFQTMLTDGQLPPERLNLWAKLDAASRASAQTSLVALPFGQMSRDDFVFVENFVYVQDQPHYHRSANTIRLFHQQDFFLACGDILAVEAHYLER